MSMEHHDLSLSMDETSEKLSSISVILVSPLLDREKKTVPQLLSSKITLSIIAMEQQSNISSILVLLKDSVFE